ncbi:efflux RND transporter periplasmic adaptor subunit [Alloyangia pacifica]|uniref:RND family efflux transporter, MFP subunit n=1 Tax=Alloyangia pacifica TaxID=311180 RepID=A0A1I6VNE4_9RHOB|nr:efflux RND transporter periplasmic adaptor subunit [Alloyangia pacifica]SDI05992.1 RND family efflux transporter, MFP subunit [Alloyangia pacifica]SFT14944.1 RND family efflux transporter, MFP subunit [Alloyangia pacifica]
MRSFILAYCLLAAAGSASADTYTVTSEPITDWKPVYGEVETRNALPARARIAGTLVELSVTEGDRVEAGQVVGTVEDEKLSVQIDALDAQAEALRAQLTNAQADLDRGQTLQQSGTISAQRLDALQTSVDVLTNQIAATEAQRRVILRQIEEGGVIAPEAGIVLSVPVSRGSFVAQGESVAVIGSGGAFLRLSIPERFAQTLAEGDRIEMETGEGKIAKLYPQIAGGRLQADVEVEGLEERYVGLRLPVRLPVGEQDSILVPEAALGRGGGLDMVIVETAEGPVQRIVVPGRKVTRDGATWREILSGLGAGEVVVIADE